MVETSPSKIPLAVPKTSHAETPVQGNTQEMTEPMDQVRITTDANLIPEAEEQVSPVNSQQGAEATKKEATAGAVSQEGDTATPSDSNASSQPQAEQEGESEPQVSPELIRKIIGKMAVLPEYKTSLEAEQMINSNFNLALEMVLDEFSAQPEIAKKHLAELKIETTEASITDEIARRKDVLDQNPEISQAVKIIETAVKTTEQAQAAIDKAKAEAQEGNTVDEEAIRKKFYDADQGIYYMTAEDDQVTSVSLSDAIMPVVNRLETVASDENDPRSSVAKKLVTTLKPRIYLDESGKYLFDVTLDREMMFRAEVKEMGDQIQKFGIEVLDAMLSDNLDILRNENLISDDGQIDIKKLLESGKLDPNSKLGRLTMMLVNYSDLSDPKTVKERNLSTDDVVDMQGLIATSIIDVVGINETDKLEINKIKNENTRNKLEADLLELRDGKFGNIITEFNKGFRLTILQSAGYSKEAAQKLVETDRYSTDRLVRDTVIAFFCKDKLTQDLRGQYNLPENIKKIISAGIVNKEFDSDEEAIILNLAQSGQTKSILVQLLGFDPDKLKSPEVAQKSIQRYSNDALKLINEQRMENEKLTDADKNSYHDLLVYNLDVKSLSKKERDIGKLFRLMGIAGLLGGPLLQQLLGFGLEQEQER